MSGAHQGLVRRDLRPVAQRPWRSHSSCRVRQRFETDLVGQTRTALEDLASNFADPTAQGPEAYAETVIGMDPALDWDSLVNDAVAAVDEFISALRLPLT